VGEFLGGPRVEQQEPHIGQQDRGNRAVDPKSAGFGFPNLHAKIGTGFPATLDDLFSEFL
jgi:hypothetical protein